MLLKIGSVILASGSDGTVSAKATKPKLTLATRSVDIQGTRFARNTAMRRHGLAFEFDVEITRQFSSYVEAEDFILPHMASLADGAQGLLVYQNVFGWKKMFDNAVLKALMPVSEIGVSTTIKYSFVCGKFIVGRALTLGQRRVLFNGKYIFI